MMFRRNVSAGLYFCAGGFLLAAASPAGGAEENLSPRLDQIESAAPKPASAEGEAVMNFTLGVKNLPKY
jgi:hypothetical protein